MSKLKYLLITLLLAALIVPVLWSAARGSLFKVSSQTNKGLVGHWKLDQASNKSTTVTADATPYGNNGTSSGSPTLGGATDQHGQASRATTFVSASSQYVSLGNNVSLQIIDDLTISAWIKTSQATIGEIVSKYDAAGSQRGYSFSIGHADAGAGKLALTISSTLTPFTGFTMPSSVAVNDNVWHHLTAVFDAGISAKIFIDGVDRSGSIVGTLQSSIANSNRNLVIGGGYNNSSTPNTSFLNGSLADVRIYNRALSATEISSLYSSYRPKQAISSLQKGLVGQWKLDQASNKSTTVTADATPYGNNGTSSGSPTLGGATDQHGQAGRATTFDGTDDVVSFPVGAIENDIGSAAAITISAWVKIAAYPVGKRARIFTAPITVGGTGFVLGLNSSNIEVGGRSVSTDSFQSYAITGPSTGVWHHLVGILDYTNDLLYLYVDGVSSSQAATFGNSSFTIGTITEAAQIAAVNPIGSEGYFNGSIADVRIYNRALSATEVTSLYNSYRPVRQISSLYKGLVLDMPLAQADLKSSTTIADKTPYGYDGTLTGSPTAAADRHNQNNKAMSFNGTSQYAWKSIADFRSGDSQGTVSAWVKCGGLGVVQNIFASRDEATTAYYFIPLRINTSNKLSIDQSNNDVADNVTGSTVFTTGVWYHVVLVSNGSSWSLYVNGVTESLTVVTGANTGDWFADTTARDNFVIGASKSSAGVTQYFNGSIHSVKVWDRALSATEITSLYNSYK